MGQTKVLGGLIEGAGTAWQSGLKTSDFTAVAGEGYFVDTTSAAITVTLPSSPSAGDEVTIVDYAGTAITNNITITSSDNINGASGDLSINYGRGGVSMVYVDATQGWIAYNAAYETTPEQAFSVDFLVVAGGGGGAGTYVGPGGGAGGLRTSYGSTSGGGASAESSMTLYTTRDYYINVGTGGAGGATASGGTGSVGSDGNDSYIQTAASVDIIRSDGGGGAGAYSSINGSAGGSGGGGGHSTGTGGAGTSGQGYAGGDGHSAAAYAGGGGGAAAAGSDASSGSSDGGDGLSVTILSASNATTASVGEVSGSAVYYAGGGAGANYVSGSPNTTGTGGLGGGGDQPSNYQQGENGTANTGGGGAGSERGSTGDSKHPGGNGGSGVVILRYPSARIITIGSGLTGSTYTEGTDKVSVFTAGTGTISFS